MWINKLDKIDLECYDKCISGCDRIRLDESAKLPARGVLFCVFMI